MIDWLVSAWNDLLAWFAEIWNSVVEFFTELPLKILSGLLDAIASVFEAIPVPDFLQNGLNGLLAAIDPSVAYFLAQSGFSQALVIIGSGYAFRLLRKLFTLGMW